MTNEEIYLDNLKILTECKNPVYGVDTTSLIQIIETVHTLGFDQPMIEVHKDVNNVVVNTFDIVLRFDRMKASNYCFSIGTGHADGTGGFIITKCNVKDWIDDRRTLEQIQSKEPDENGFELNATIRNYKPENMEEEPSCKVWCDYIPVDSVESVIEKIFDLRKF